VSGDAVPGVGPRPAADARLRLHARLAPVLLASLLASAGCGSTPPPKDARTTPVSTSAPEPFQDMHALVVRIGRLRDASDAAGARALRTEVLSASKALLLMPPPGDLRREDIARFLDARERYTDAANQFSAAAQGTDDAALWTSSRALEAAYWAWYDAYRGRPTEGSI
jgi:hypothetical protein